MSRHYDMGNTHYRSDNTVECNTAEITSHFCWRNSKAVFCHLCKSVLVCTYMICVSMNWSSVLREPVWTSQEQHWLSGSSPGICVNLCLFVCQLFPYWSPIDHPLTFFFQSSFTSIHLIMWDDHGYNSTPFKEPLMTIMEQGLNAPKIETPSLVAGFNYSRYSPSHSLW